MKLFSLFALLLVIASCQSKPKKLIPLENLKIPLREKIKRSMETEYLEVMGIDEKTGQFLTEFYGKDKFKPKWINDSTLTEKGQQLKKILSNKLQFGIPDSRYKSLKWKKTSFLQDEILITTTLAFLAKDIQSGFLHPDTLLVKTLEPISSAELSKIIRFDSDTMTVEQQLVNLGPADTNYRQLADGLLEYCSHYPTDTNSFKVEPFKKDTLHAEENARASLFSKRYLASKDADSLTFVKALSQFQIHNGLKPDGVIGTYTAKALSESTVHKLLRTAVAMEKWRWKSKYPKKYIRINLPEFKLRLFTDDTLRSFNSIIVGKPETPTPELSSSIRQIVVFPYWVVPQSICNKEILPKVKNNVNYLARNDYKIFRKDVEVDPKTVNWSRYKDAFPFRVRQEFGPKNSLGIIKFEFHNKYGVYVHDTPQRNLFSSDIRAFSHGCMRCQYPVQLAKTILMKDSIRGRRNDIDTLKLDSLFALGENHRIDLRDPIPIFVEYKTVTVSNKVLIFHPDIYGRDEKYLKLLK